MKHFDARTQPLKGRHSIEASAGTGKTYSITLLWLRLLVEEHLTVDQVLVCTFTRAATAELKERLLASLRRAVRSAEALERESAAEACEELNIIERHRRATNEPPRKVLDRLSLALSTFDLAPISTIHSFCQSLLSRHALELGSDSQLKVSQDNSETLEEIRDDSLLPLTELFNPDPKLLSETTRLLESHPSAKVHSPEQTLEQLTTAWLHAVRVVENRMQTFQPRSRSKKIRSAREKLQCLADCQIWLKPLDKEEMKSLAREPGGSELADLYEEAGVLKRQIETFRLCAEFRQILQGRKNLQGSRSMNDLVFDVYEALHAVGAGHEERETPLARAVRKRIQAAIIDECQDSDLLQIEVFKTLFSHPSTTSFIVIGDPKQSIYRFRGADLASYKNLASSADQAPQMTVNYRSDDALVACLNALYQPDFEFPDSRNFGAKTHYVPVTANARDSRIADPLYQKPLVFFFSPSKKRDEAGGQIANWVAAECHRLLQGGVTILDRHSGLHRPLLAGDIAVLAPGHRELRMCRQKLNSVGIPCQSSGNGLGSVYESDEAQDVLSWLELLSALQEGGEILGKLCTFLGTPLGAKTPPEIVGLRQNASDQAVLCAEFQRELTELQRSGPLPVLLRGLARPEWSQHFLASSEGERLFTNWRQLGALLQAEFARGRRSPKTLAVWLSRKIATPDEQSAEDSEETTLMRLETDAPAVQLVTIHSSKGLEYPVVFCPYVWSVRSRVHRKKAKVALFREEQGWGLDAGSRRFEQNLEIALEQEDEEEHRKLYVALTRPRHRLYIGVAAIPPQESGQNHENSSDMSAFADLPGLALGDLSNWGESLKNLPWSQFVSTDSNRRLPSEGAPLASGCSKSSLVSEPQRPVYGFPFFAKRSFSSLSKSDLEPHSHAADRDHSQESGQEGEGAEVAKTDLLQALGEAGSVLGDRLHRALENFLGNRMELSAAVAGFKEKTAWEAAVREIVSTPFALGGAASTTLENVRGGCITEMQFHLPVDRLEPALLSMALAQDSLIASDPARLRWAKSLASWAFSDFTGFLQGFIDLIFEHEGRWYVADYKSNKLRAYHPGKLEDAMLSHHYLLQARIYNLALHRHLSHHLDQYDYERHFGGVVYLFVRGFPDQGGWFEKPDLASVERFGNLFGKQPLP
jgi:exodeoxyribonuclease V beta subunit